LSTFTPLINLDGLSGLMGYRVAPVLGLILPAFIFLPLLALLPGALHGGGWPLIVNFLTAALQPSLTPNLKAIAITLAVALWSWLLSMAIGLLAGVLCSPTVTETLLGCRWPAGTLRRVLALPRSLHELLWGLVLLQVLGLQPFVAVLAIAIPYGALVARVVCDQLESLSLAPFNALRSAGVPGFAALVTTLGPSLLPGALSYGGYRLECALRSATLLGVFGLGGVGADLRLSLQSLQFREAWSSLWMLAIVMFLLEQGIALLRRRWLQPGAWVGQRGRELVLLLVVLGLLLFPAAQLLDLQWQVLLGPWRWPLPNEVFQWSGWLQPWPQLVAGTILLTLMAALAAFAAPPLLLLICWPWAWLQPLLRTLGLFARLLPPPLTALLLLFVLKPGLLPAALALAFHNAGILGRLFLEGLDGQDPRPELALKAAGVSSRKALLMARYNGIATSYLAYGAYRADVILRETVVVGLVGAGGLGIVFVEALSSFAWAEVLPVLVVYAGLTLLGEELADRYRRFLLLNHTQTGGSLPPRLELLARGAAKRA
jgi:phosphonate transport system permease protein